MSLVPSSLSIEPPRSTPPLPTSFGQAVALQLTDFLGGQGGAETVHRCPSGMAMTSVNFKGGQRGIDGVESMECTPLASLQAGTTNGRGTVEIEQGNGVGDKVSRCPNNMIALGIVGRVATDPSYFNVPLVRGAQLVCGGGTSGGLGDFQGNRSVGQEVRINRCPDGQIPTGLTVRAGGALDGIAVSGCVPLSSLVPATVVQPGQSTAEAAGENPTRETATPAVVQGSEEDEGLSTGAIVGISVAALVFIVVIIVVSVLIAKKNKNGAKK